jgi:hypothetical protein
VEGQIRDPGLLSDDQETSQFWAGSAEQHREVRGPGQYKNEPMALHLGKTALEDSYLGLGTVTIATDGKSGTFALNDGKHVRLRGAAGQIDVTLWG